MALTLEELARLVEAQAQTLQSQSHELAALKAKLADLAEVRPAMPANPARLGRRRLLAKLGLGLLAGTTALTANLGQAGNEAQAKIGATLPTVGAVIAPRASTVTGSLANGTTVGLLASSLPTFNLGTITPASWGVYGTGVDVGLLGSASGSTGIGVLGKSDGLNSFGVYGSSNGGIGVQGLSSSNKGVYGSSDNDIGVYGNSINSNGVQGVSSIGTGVHGKSDSGIGVVGESNSTYGVVGFSSSNTGVFGNTSSGTGVFANSTSGTGVFANGSTGAKAEGTFLGAGVSANGSLSASLPSNVVVGVIANASVDLPLSSFATNQYIGLYAVAGTTNGITSHAAYFNGNVIVTGNLAKGSLSFKIDHPLDPENKYLYHSGVESPDMLNLYNGNVKLDTQGEANVTLPDWFEALNRDFRYQLTAMGSASPNLHIAGEVSGNRFKIAGGQPGQQVSWQVSGIRQDRYAKAHPVPVEQDKTSDEKGRYLHPEVWGHGPERGMTPAGTSANTPKKPSPSGS